MQNMNAFNLQLHVQCFDIVNIKRWIMIFTIIKKMKIYFKCEIKTASRWQQVIVNKWVIVIEPNHLNGLLIDSFRKETPSCCSEMQNSAVAVFGIIFVGEIEQKQALLCLKCKSL